MFLVAVTGTGGGTVLACVVWAHMPMPVFFVVGGIRLTAAGALPAVPRLGDKLVRAHATTALKASTELRIVAAITAVLDATTLTSASLAAPGVGTVLAVSTTHPMVAAIV